MKGEISDYTAAVIRFLPLLDLFALTVHLPKPVAAYAAFSQRPVRFLERINAALCMFDGMPSRHEESDMPAEAATAGGEDRISELPDDLLRLVLSSLPSDDVVRTCVLARRWRHLWQSTRAVRVTERAARPWTARTLRNFVDHLLLLRGGAPADEFEISCDELHDDDFRGDELSDPAQARRRFDFGCAAGLWIRHALSFCQARVIKVCIRYCHRLQLKDVPFVSHSQHLMRLEITDATINLVCVSSGKAPFLEKMPLLIAADVRIQDGCADMYLKNDGYWDCDLDGCYDCYGVSNGSRSVLFEGLSSATDLELTCDPRAFIFRMDCKFCTKFGNLKTLLLNEWCMATDFDALVYFLRYSPILENLTLQLEYCEKEFAVVATDENYNPIENFLVSEQLKVEIKCCKKNDLVAKILMILKTHGVPPEQISIQENFCPPYTSGYTTTDSDFSW
ncbi:hypothetical protein ACP70R_004216 [Stipagrostis hirtigluma subsp. patula]